MTIALILLLALILPSLYGDIPDHAMSSDSYREIEHSGDDHLLEVQFSVADSIFNCFGYTISEGNTDFWILEISCSGFTVNRQPCPSPEDNSMDESSEFILLLENGNSLFAGSEYQNEQTAGISELVDTLGNTLWKRTDWYNDHTAFSSALQTQDGSFLVGGWTGEEISPGVIETNALLALVSADGNQITATELLANGDQHVRKIYLTNSEHVVVIGTVIQPDKNCSNVFFWKIHL
ncbi:MAG: hypothetical protein U9P42_01770, partial [Candidatus Fermentibacteria bacterium]|nr:hypothetical protein [Candidatus Fermentibacteria bacterium]